WPVRRIVILPVSVQLRYQRLTIANFYTCTRRRHVLIARHQDRRKSVILIAGRLAWRHLVDRNQPDGLVHSRNISGRKAIKSYVDAVCYFARSMTGTWVYAIAVADVGALRR